MSDQDCAGIQDFSQQAASHVFLVLATVAGSGHMMRHCYHNGQVQAMSRRQCQLQRILQQCRCRLVCCRSACRVGATACASVRTRCTHCAGEPVSAAQPSHRQLQGSACRPLTLALLASARCCSPEGLEAQGSMRRSWSAGAGSGAGDHAGGSVRPTHPAAHGARAAASLQHQASTAAGGTDGNAPIPAGVLTTSANISRRASVPHSTAAVHRFILQKKSSIAFMLLFHLFHRC